MIRNMQDLLQADPGVVLREQSDVFRIVERIRAIDPNLDVAYLDPDKATITDAPYMIFEWCRDGVPRVLFSVWEMDERVIDRIHAADTTKVDIEAAIEKANEAAREEARKKSQETIAEGGDIIAHAFANPKTSYTFPSTTGEVVKLDEKGIVKRERK